MNKTELIRSVCISTGVSRRQATRIVNAVFESISDALATGQSVHLSGFGVFDIREAPPRLVHGFNDSPVELRRLSPTFRASPLLKDRVSSNH